MGYQMANGRWADTQEVTVRSSAALAATANTSAVEVGDRGVVRLMLDVTAASGTTPTLDVAIQTSADGSTGWTTIASFAQATAISASRKVFAGCDRYVRAACTVGGTTPSFTFSISGEAV